MTSLTVCYSSVVASAAWWRGQDPSTGHDNWQLENVHSFRPVRIAHKMLLLPLEQIETCGLEFGGPALRTCSSAWTRSIWIFALFCVLIDENLEAPSQNVNKQLENDDVMLEITNILWKMSNNDSSLVQRQDFRNDSNAYCMFTRNRCESPIKMIVCSSVLAYMYDVRITRVHIYNMHGS